MAARITRTIIRRLPDGASTCASAEATTFCGCISPGAVAPRSRVAYASKPSARPLSMQNWIKPRRQRRRRDFTNRTRAMPDMIDTRYDVIIEERECPRPDGSAMALRIARPKGAGPFPAAIDIHGGGWVLHARHRNAYIDDTLAAAGIVVAAPEFRKPPEGVYPISVADNHLAIRWLKQNAATFGSRPDLVGAIGTSSGGHQLMLCALRPDDPRYGALALPGPAFDATLRFTVACWSVFDPLVRYHMVRDKNVKHLLAAHAAYWSDEAPMAEGNRQLILESPAFTQLPPLLRV